MLRHEANLFVERFPALLPLEPQESKGEALNFLEMEFVKLHAFVIPPGVLQEKWADVQWNFIFQLGGIDGLLKFQRISAVMLGILSIPHSNAECARQFSSVKRNHTHF